jgi:hypothetical protein
MAMPPFSLPGLKLPPEIEQLAKAVGQIGIELANLVSEMKTSRIQMGQLTYQLERLATLYESRPPDMIPIYGDFPDEDSANV